MSQKFPRGTLDRYWADPDNWLPLGIYRCQDDPRLIVPKRIKALGWTLNAAHRPAWIAVVALILTGTLILPEIYLKELSMTAAIAFLVLWVACLVTACRVMSATGQHED